MEEMYEAHRIASAEDCQEDEAELMLAEDLESCASSRLR